MRSTNELPLEAAANLIEAHDHAARIGQPLRYFLTIHWKFTGYGSDPRRGWAAMRERASKFLYRQGHPLTLIYVHERSGHGGFHTHALIWLPSDLVAPFSSMIERWIGGNTGTQQNRPAIIKPVRDRGALSYVLKDIDPAHAEQLRIRRPSADRRSAKPIEGKRAGTTENLGPKARLRVLEQRQVA